MIFEITQTTFFAEQIMTGGISYCVRIESPDLYFRRFNDPCPVIAECLTKKEADAIVETLNMAVGKIQAIKQGFYARA